MPANGLLKLSGINVTAGQVISAANLSTLTFVPTTNFNGNTSFTLSASDGTDFSAPATINFTISPVNDTPTLTLLSKTGTEDTTLTFTATDFTSQYSDADGTALNSIRIDSLATNGTLRLSGVAVTAGQIITSANIANLTFVPNANYNGTANFTWSATDGTAYSTSTNANLNISAVNDTPTLTTLSKTGTEDTALTFTATDFTSQYSDIEGTALNSIRIDSLATNGTLRLSGVAVTAGQIITSANIANLTFVPNANFNGTANFTWSATDGTAYSTSSTATVNISAVNDAPTLTALSKTGTEDTTLSFTATDFTSQYTDLDGDLLNSIRIDSLATNGTLQLSGVAVTAGQIITSANIANLTFVPNANYNGTANFTWSATDGTVYSSSSTATLNISAVNDAPTLTALSKTGTEDTTLSFTATDFTSKYSDIEGTALNSIRIDSLATNGTLQLSGIAVTAGQVITSANIANLTFVPNANYNGTANFNWSATDGTAYSASSTATLNINAVNDTPTLTLLSKTGVEDTTLSFTASDFTSQYTDLDGTALNSIRIDSLATNGTLRLSGVAVTAGQVISSANIANLTFVPTANYNGTANFTWSATDGTAYSTSSTATLNISAVNDAPTVANINKTFNEDTTLSFAAFAPTDLLPAYNDIEGTALSAVRIDSLPANGLLKLSGVNVTAGQVISAANLSTLTFVPTTNFNGNTSFTLSASDGTDFSAPATINFTITQVNDAPTLTALSKIGTEDTTLSFTASDFTSQYTDIEGTALNSIRIDSLATNGTLRLSGVAVTAGQVITSANIANLTFVPNANYNGTANFTWSASDGSAYSTSSTATLTITPVNDAPVITASSGIGLNEGLWSWQQLRSGDSSTIYSVHPVNPDTLRLNTNDVDTPRNQIVYTINSTDDSAQNGYIWGHGNTRFDNYTGTGAWINSFTQDDIDKGWVVFAHNGSEDSTAGFTYTVTDGTNTVNGTFVTTVTTVNDAPIIAGDLNATVNESGRYILTSADLTATDPDSSSFTYNPSVVTNVTLQTWNGSAWVNATTFTQAQLLAGQVSFVQNGSENATASFAVNVSDGALTSANSTFNITPTLLNDINANDFLVNTSITAGLPYYTDGADIQITNLSNGGFVVTWYAGNSVGGRVFNADGTPVNATDFLVNTATTGTRDGVQITNLSNGGFVVSWTDNNYDIKGRVFNADGTAVNATDFLVSTTNLGYQEYQQITGLSNGGFVVTWRDDNSGSSNYDIRARVFTANGTPVNANDFLVNTTTTGTQTSPQITNLSNGGFVVHWEDDRSGNYDIRARVFSANGTAVNATDFLVSTTTGNGLVQITSLSNGSFVATWLDNISNLRARVFNADGTAVNATDFLVSTTSSVSYQQIISLSNGGFVVTWQDTSSGYWNSDIRARVFDAAGNPVYIGTTGNDVFVSSTTNETVSGNTGNDFYVFRGAFGNDVINDTGGTDRLDLMDFAYGDYFTRIEGGTNGDNLVITLAGRTIST